MDRQIGKYERLYRGRHERDLALSQQEGGHPKGFTFDPSEGERVVEFVEGFCRHYEAEWAGQPMMLEPWQKELLGIIFGWLGADGNRRFRTAYIEIPRKNGKSFLCSALAMYLLMADGEPGPQVYSFATKQEQAAIVWNGAVKMVQQSPGLERFCEIHGEKAKTGGTIFCGKVNGRFRPLGADSKTQDGLSPHGTVADELHEHSDRRVWTKLRTATGARRQPLQIEITTAGVYDPESIGWQEHKYAQDILDELLVDDGFFAFIAAADDDDEVFSVETQKKANPNYGVSAKVDFLAGIATLAQNQPTVYNDYLRYHLNMWVQQVTRWLSIEKWKASDPVADPFAIREVREKALENRKCWGGLDLAQTHDMNALALAFQGVNDTIELLLRYWVPAARVAQETKEGRPQYAQWVKDGWLKTTPGAVTDYAFIRREILELRRQYRIEEIAYDPYNASQLVIELEEQDGVTMVKFDQGYKTISAPAKEFERRTVAGTFKHGGHPILAYNVNNAVVVTDANGNIKPDKSVATRKIDGLSASINSIGRLTVCAPASGSAYDKRGVRTT